MPTQAGSLPAGMAGALTDFCGRRPDIETAYVCMARLETPAMPDQVVLVVGIKLRGPRAEPDGAADILLGLRRDLGAHRPHLGEVRLALLADRALGAWSAHGVRVFPSDLETEGGAETQI